MKKTNNGDINPIDDDLLDYISLKKHLEDDTERKKELIKSEFEIMGEKYLNEIERKEKNRILKKNKLIPYILKHSDYLYSEDELNSYSFEDVLDIYKTVKAENRPIILKILYYLLNIQ